MLLSFSITCSSSRQCQSGGAGNLWTNIPSVVIMFRLHCAEMRLQGIAFHLLVSLIWFFACSNFTEPNETQNEFCFVECGAVKENKSLSAYLILNYNIPQTFLLLFVTSHQRFTVNRLHKTIYSKTHQRGFQFINGGFIWLGFIKL